MNEDERTEGYNFIQCSEISSTSDVLNSNFNPILTRVLHGRPTYRSFATPVNLTDSALLAYRIPRYPAVPNPMYTCRNKIEMLSTRNSLICVILIFMCSLFALSVVYTKFPELTEDERKHIRVPWNIDQAKQLGVVLNRYKDDNYFEVIIGVFVTYIFLQTFAIPGSLFLSILSGFLFPFFSALFLVCTCSALGASLCFMLSQLLGRKLVLKYCPQRAKEWAVIVNKQKDNLFNYIVFLRITPFLPNWFINLTAPVIGVPLKPFAFGTFFGVAPPSFLAIQAGQTLNTMSNSDTSVSLSSVLLLSVFAVVSIIPIILRNRLKVKFD